MLALVVSLATLIAAPVPAGVASPSPVPHPAASTATAQAAAAPRCTTAGLVMWLNPEGSGTAGSFYYKLEFVNLSGRTCTLAGYPGVSAVSLSGRQIGASAKREVTGRPRTVMLPPKVRRRRSCTSSTWARCRFRVARRRPPGSASIRLARAPRGWCHIRSAPARTPANARSRCVRSSANSR